MRDLSKISKKNNYLFYYSWQNRIFSFGSFLLMAVGAMIFGGCSEGVKKSDFSEKIQAANESLRNGQWDNAIELYSAVLEQTPEDLAVRYGRAGAHLALGHQYYLSAESAAEIGHIDQAEKEAQKADDAFQKAENDALFILKNQPDHSDAHYLLGSIRLYQGDWDGAIGEFSAVIRIEPENPYPYQRRGEVYGHINDTVNEATDLKRAAELGYKGTPETESVDETPDAEENTGEIGEDH